MEKIMNLLWDWRYVIVYTISFILFVIRQGLEWAKAEAYSRMLQAKSLAKDGVLNTGQEQEDWAVKQLYLVLKKFKIPFISEDVLRVWIRKLYKISKDYLDDGKINNSI